jgi:hypothetical protein
MKFDEFRQRHKDNQISTRFLVNKELVKATERAQRDAAVGPMGRQRSMQRLGPRRALSPIREVPGRSGEGIVNYTPSTEWARRHHTSGPTRPRPRVPRIPQLTFTSRPSPLPDGAPLQQRSNTGNGVDIHQNTVETRNTSHLPSLDISRSASHAPQPVPSVEHIGPDLQEQRSRQVRVDPIPQEQMETAEARPKSEDHVDLSLIEDQPTEEDDQRLRATNQEFGDPINNDEFPSVPSDVRRAVDLISAVPQGTPEAAANALTGMTLTDHLMQMMEKAAVRPDRTSAPSLRQAKLDERARRVQMKRQIVNLSLDESDDALPAKYKQTSLKPVKIPDPQVTRSKTAVKSTPSRIGLNRSKSVGTESQVTAKQLKKRYESKTAAALIIRALPVDSHTNCSQPIRIPFSQLKPHSLPANRCRCRAQRKKTKISPRPLKLDRVATIK